MTGDDTNVTFRSSRTGGMTLPRRRAPVPAMTFAWFRARSAASSTSRPDESMTTDLAGQNERAHSPLFKSHLRQVATIGDRHLGIDGLVEVGCGKA